MEIKWSVIFMFGSPLCYLKLEIVFNTVNRNCYWWNNLSVTYQRVLDLFNHLQANPFAAKI